MDEAIVEQCPVLTSRGDLVELIRDVYRLLKRNEFKYELAGPDGCHWCGGSKTHDPRCRMKPLLDEMHSVMREHR
jgi:hypothetical protein